MLIVGRRLLMLWRIWVFRKWDLVTIAIFEGICLSRWARLLPLIQMLLIGLAGGSRLEQGVGVGVVDSWRGRGIVVSVTEYRRLQAVFTNAGLSDRGCHCWSRGELFLVFVLRTSSLAVSLLKILPCVWLRGSQRRRVALRVEYSLDGRFGRIRLMVDSACLLSIGNIGLSRRWSITT